MHCCSTDSTVLSALQYGTVVAYVGLRALAALQRMKRALSLLFISCKVSALRLKFYNGFDVQQLASHGA
jgi:hypothetical protein